MEEFIAMNYHAPVPYTWYPWKSYISSSRYYIYCTCEHVHGPLSHTTSNTIFHCQYERLPCHSSPSFKRKIRRNLYKPSSMSL